MENVKHVPVRPGFFVLDYKIEKYDEYNWVIKKKDPNAKERVVKNRGVTYIYDSDGYSRLGHSYFQTVGSALKMILQRYVPQDLADEVDTLGELADRLDNIAVDAVKQLNGQM